MPAFVLLKPNWLLLFVCLWLALHSGFAAWAAADEQSELDTFHEQLKQLAAKCDELKLPEAGAATRSLIVERDPQRTYCFLTGDSELPVPANPSQLETQWFQRLTTIRSQYASRLFELAQLASERGNDAQTFRLLHEVLFHDPAHELAAQALDRGSAKQVAPIRSRSGRTTHREFGWRRNQYSIISSDHFLITTNHNVEAGRQLAQLLERFHEVWQQVFFDFWSHEGALAKRLRGESTPLGPRRKYQVVLFRDRNEYVTQLTRIQPQIAKSIGYYSDRLQKAYFYVGDAATVDSWYHEVTHQLLQESRGARPNVAVNRDYWAIEAIALYMESVAFGSGYATVGGFDANRLQFARYRAIREDNILPLDRLAALSRDDLQRHPEIKRIYSQAAGLAHCFMDRGAENRATWLAYLKALYEGQDNAYPSILLKTQSSSQIDAAYRPSMRVTADQLAFLRPSSSLRNLCLTQAELTDDALSFLKGYDQLKWVDLSFTSIGDEGVRQLAAARQLDQLNLESTQVSDASLKTVRHFGHLQELDLSNTRVTDAGMPLLSQLKQLKILWLTGTAVSDAAVPHLEKLVQLELLNLQGTQVTAKAQQRLFSKLPKLQQ